MRTHSLQTGADLMGDGHYVPLLWVNGNEVWRSRHLFDDEEAAAEYAEERLRSTFGRLMRD